MQSPGLAHGYQGIKQVFAGLVGPFTHLQPSSAYRWVARVHFSTALDLGLQHNCPRKRPHPQTGKFKPTLTTEERPTDPPHRCFARP